MALVLKDRVLETSQTGGTGTLTLAGAVDAFQSFSSAIGNGNTTYYTIADDADNQWEVGIGTVGAGTLSRDTVLASSNGGSLVNFGTSIKQVFCDYPASKAVYANESNKIHVDGNSYIDYESAPATTVAAGRMWYNDTDGNWNLGMGGGNITQQIGEELFIYGKASAAITDSPLQIVYHTGTVGASGVIKFAPTVAGITDVNAIIGVATESIPLNGFGRITSFGVIHGITTNGTAFGETWANDDVIWYNPVTGNPTNIKPVAPNMKVQVGIVINAGSGGSGSFQVLLQSGTQLGGTDSNVQITSPTNNQILTYDGTVSYWKNSSNLDGVVIGATTPASGKFTTLEATGNSTLGTASAQYIQVEGNATYPRVSAQGSGTNIPLVLQPKGTGALQAQLTDSTATGGNARGANAVDWQMSRTAASMIALGNYSFIGSGVNNTASGTYSLVAGGSGNSSIAITSGVLAGFLNQANGGYSFVGAGQQNIASGQWSAICGGMSNGSASQFGYHNFIGGGYANTGTATAAVTTQATTTVTAGSTAVTLSGSNAAIKIGQLITGTGIGNNIHVAAISGTSLTLSANASTSGSPTLSFYTPHGVVVGGGNNQATGSYSFIGGGGDAGTAANRNTASQDWATVCGGRGNTASGYGSFIGGGGFYNTVSGNVGNTASSDGAAILGGFSNVASAFGSSIIGGNGNVANATYSTVLGTSFGTTRAIQGNTVIPANNNPLNVGSAGVAQTAVLVLGRQTTDATATVLASSSAAASTNNQVILPNNSAYHVRGQIIAGVTGAGNTSTWDFKGAIKRGANAASTVLVGAGITANLVAQDAGAATWAVAIAADTTNGGLKITVTGQAATTIRWVASVETTEMTF